MTPLDRIAAQRFPGAMQWAARVAICAHVRGAGEIGPRWRRGSNSRRPDKYEEEWSGKCEPCHHCGADGGDLSSWQHFIFCHACGEEWVAGDYDWHRLGDVLRYKADEAGGLIETAPTGLIVHGYDVTSRDGHRAFVMECHRLREEREADQPKTWLLPWSERLAQLRDERAGYLAGRAGVRTNADSGEFFKVGYRRGEGICHTLAQTGLRPSRHA